MPEKVYINTDLNIIQVDSYGKVTQADMDQSLEEVLKIYKDKGISKVLVQARKQESLPPLFSIHDFGVSIAEKSRDLRYAVLPPNETFNDQKFLENVAFNRGGHVNIFEDEEIALDWLLDRNKNDS